MKPLILIKDFFAVIGNNDAFVVFDNGWADWIEAKYLTVVSGPI